jgi:methyl-accepting chemotaxis protein
MSGEIRVSYQSIDEATEKLIALFYELDAHRLYTDLLAESQGYTRNEAGLLADEFNTLKTTLGQLIDGTRLALRATSETFAAADANAAAKLGVL